MKLILTSKLGITFKGIFVPFDSKHTCMGGDVTEPRGGGCLACYALERVTDKKYKIRRLAPKDKQGRCLCGTCVGDGFDMWICNET